MIDWLLKKRKKKKKNSSQTQSGAVSKATSRCIFSSYRSLNTTLQSTLSYYCFYGVEDLPIFETLA